MAYELKNGAPKCDASFLLDQKAKELYKQGNRKVKVICDPIAEKRGLRLVEAIYKGKNVFFIVSDSAQGLLEGEVIVSDNRKFFTESNLPRWAKRGLDKMGRA